ncbi:MAG: hypothetical protein EPN34_14755 [Burkholderiaceae bacterium]|nr:MAG: hypothetical protein EPN34_14755 [Burkholderiaceae bacterium]
MNTHSLKTVIARARRPVARVVTAVAITAAVAVAVSVAGFLRTHPDAATPAVQAQITQKAAALAAVEAARHS